MKKTGWLSLTLLALASTQVMAAPKIEITSFSPVDSNITWRLAEICGKVSGVEKDFTAVRVVPDYNTSNPGNYMTFTARDGLFCQVIMTLTGTVEVSLGDGTSKVSVRSKLTQTIKP